MNDDLTARLQLLREAADALTAERQARERAEEELAANRACNLYTWKERAEQAEQDRDRLREALIRINALPSELAGDAWAIARAALSTQDGQR